MVIFDDRGRYKQDKSGWWFIPWCCFQWFPFLPSFRTAPPCLHLPPSTYCAPTRTKNLHISTFTHQDHPEEGAKDYEEPLPPVEDAYLIPFCIVLAVISRGALRALCIDRAHQALGGAPYAHWWRIEVETGGAIIAFRQVSGAVIAAISTSWAIKSGGAFCLADCCVCKDEKNEQL